MSKNTKQNNSRSGMILFLFCPPLLHPRAVSQDLNLSLKLGHREAQHSEAGNLGSGGAQGSESRITSSCPCNKKQNQQCVCCSEKIHWLVSLLSSGKKVRLWVSLFTLPTERGARGGCSPGDERQRPLLQKTGTSSHSLSVYHHPVIGLLLSWKLWTSANTAK